MNYSTGAVAYAEMPKRQQKRVRAVVVGAFGEYLRGCRLSLPNEPSVEMVAQTLRGRGFSADDSSVRSYEYGWIERPDPVILLGLAELYKIDIIAIISILAANRLNPNLSTHDVTRILQSVQADQQNNAASAARLATLTDELQSLGSRLLTLSADSGQADARPDSKTRRNKSKAL